MSQENQETEKKELKAKKVSTSSFPGLSEPP